MRGEFVGRAFIPLYPDPEADEALLILGAHLVSTPPGPVVCLKPPVAGLAFITTVGQVSEMLDDWWVANVPEGSLPVLLTLHEPGLEDWVPVLDAEVVVGVPREEDLGLYARAANVRALVASDPRAVTAHAMRCYPEWFRDEGATPSDDSVGVLPDVDPFPATVRMGGVLSAGGGHREEALSGRTRGLPSEAGGPWSIGGAFTGRSMDGIRDDRDRGEERHASLRSLAETDPVDQAGDSLVPRELMDLALAHRTGRIVGVTSQGGGVRRTAIAAALGVVYGEAVQESGWYAALVEQTGGEVGQWRRLGLTGPARTVNEIMADVEAGRRWPIMAWDRSPALVLYPERPGVEGGYGSEQIERLASRLRQLHCMSVVDLPGRVPAFTSAEAALCAGWTSVSDLLLVPATDDPAGLQEVLDYLDAPLVAGDERAGLQPVPVIVARLRSPRRGHEEPAARAMLEVIQRRVTAVVEIPEDEPASLAVTGGLAAVEPSLRQAYIELALVVARALLDS
ncbi:MAG TPA: hypothetical protein VKY90_00645 [Candidatus Dormibacteraeota bacterium]|nr:hypothetical protein [Candidatus Dormibacteraeota bacterium]